jgi:hypothetical protein
MMTTLFSKLQNLKTSIIDIIAIIYGIGLINWSINAYQNSLGLISAFDTQYFVAGFVPFIVFLLIYYALINEFSIIYSLFRRLRGINKKLLRKYPRGYVIVTMTTSMLFFLSFAGIVGYKAYNENSYWELALSGFYFVLAVLFAYLLITKKAHRPKRVTSFKIRRRLYFLLNPVKLSVVYAKFTITMFCLMLLIAYAFLIYPKIPQELGGAKPKRCIIECRKEAFNSVSALKLFADKALDRNVYVYYYNSDKIIFKQDEYSASTYEISRKDVELIEWIEGEK